MVSSPVITSTADKVTLRPARWAVRQNVVLWDKDSTLASTLHRQHMVAAVKAGEATWADYSLACEDDEPVRSAVALMRLLQPDYLQLVATASDCIATGLVQGWLHRHRIPADALWMRPPDDHTESGLLKVRWIRELEAEGKDVVLAVEDWPATAQVIREMTGVEVLVLNPCYPAELAAAAEHRAAGI